MITTAGVAVPEDMVDALAQDAEAQSLFEALRHDDQLAYVNWLAKPGAQTRKERLAELASHVRNHKFRSSPTD